MNYYRLKQVDYDGQYEYSDIIAVLYQPDGSNELLVFPNPTKGGFFVSYAGEISEQAPLLVILYDMMGNEVYSKVIVSENDNGSVIAIDPENQLEAGIYFVVGSTDNTLYRKKLVITR